MLTSMRQVVRARAASTVLHVPRGHPLVPSLTQPLLAPSPPHLPTLLPCLQQQVQRFSCGECPENKNEKKDKGDKKGKNKKSKDKGGQCSPVKGKGKKGGQCTTVKGKGKSKEVKGKQDKSKEHDEHCSELEGKRKETDGCSSRSIDTAKEVSRAKTVICEGGDEIGYDDKPMEKETCGDKPKKKETCDALSSTSSSSSSSDSECSDKEKKKGDKAEESSDDDQMTKRECIEEPLEEPEEEKCSPSASDMCACIQAALAQTEGAQKVGGARKPQPKPAQGRPSPCGSPLKKAAEPKISEHVRCCEVETSKTAPLKSGASRCKAMMEEAERECSEDNEGEDGQGGPEYCNDPCECIQKALHNCEKAAKKTVKKDNKCGEIDGGSVKKDNKCGEIDGGTVKKDNKCGEIDEISVKKDTKCDEIDETFDKKDNKCDKLDKTSNKKYCESKEGKKKSDESSQEDTSEEEEPSPKPKHKSGKKGCK